MTAARYLIAKYIPDLFRGEPRNIGVVLWSKAGVAARFVAEKPRYPGQVFLSSIPPFVTSPSAYRQWIEYWRGEITEATLRPIDFSAGPKVEPTPVEFLDALTRSSRGNFVLTPGGEVLDNVTDPEAAADYLYATLVGVEEKPRIRKVAAVCKELIHRHKLDKDDNFKTQLVVDDVVTDGVRDVMKFSYGYQNGSLRRLYQRVEIGSKTGVVEDGVHAAVWKFAQVTREKLAKNDAVSLILLAPQSAAEFGRSPTGALLHSVSRVVNVADTAAADTEFAGLADLAHH